MEEPKSSNQLSLLSQQRDGSTSKDSHSATQQEEQPTLEPTNDALSLKAIMPELTPTTGDAPQQESVEKTASIGGVGYQTLKRPSLWYALYFPQLHRLDDQQQKEALTHLAGIAESISSTVSFHELALVCEIRSSLSYFGGINPLHEKLKKPIEKALSAQGHNPHFFYAASPTVSGSLLLARSGQNTLVYQQDNLRSALGKLPIDVLKLSEEQNRRLHNMGIRHLKDIWRLPIDGIRKRFGSEFINLLNKALGKAAEPTQNYLPPPTFSSSYDLPYELENLDRLLPVVDEIIAQLCDFLTRRDLATGHLLFSLNHEKQSPTIVEISLRKASRSSTHFLMLIETYFHNLVIPAPVISVKLDVNQFDAFTSQTEALKLDGSLNSSACENSLNQFMEQLKARLGDDYLKSISCVAEHRPEYASASLGFNKRQETNSHSRFRTQEVARRPRPLWLLDPPKELVEKNGFLYHRKAITILSGPERIETAWWAGPDVRRDYYVAQEASGSRLWIYRERSGERRWLLHGYFS
ncbi:MAG: DNA polymerase Y family protein [Pseudohongiellaceae bacterium]